MQHQSILNAKFTRQTGISMVELLIAMAMGLAITTVVLNIFLNMMTGNRVSTAQQQMNEDAQAAFQILGSQIRMAGFNPLQARISTPEKNQLSVSAIPATETALGVFGCNTGFVNGAISAGTPTTPATPAASEIWQLICKASGTQPSIAIHYEADQFSPNVTNAAIAADCRGFTVPEQTQALANSNGSSAGSAKYRLVENRYFIANGGLSCTGNGSIDATAFDTITQPLVPNIESMQIQYGVRAPQPFATVTGNPATWTPSQIAANQANTDAARVTAGYLTADQIGPASGSVNTGVHSGFLTAAATTVQPNIINGSYRWALVNTVRICLVVKSATRVLTEKVTDDGTAIHGYYFGCDPTTNTPQKIREDGFMRKAYTMHFAIRSRVNTPL